jgi:hypothetical protein
VVSVWSFEGRRGVDGRERSVWALFVRGDTLSVDPDIDAHAHLRCCILTHARWAASQNGENTDTNVHARGQGVHHRPCNSRYVEVNTHHRCSRNTGRKRPTTVPLVGVGALVCTNPPAQNSKIDPPINIFNSFCVFSPFSSGHSFERTGRVQLKRFGGNLPPYALHGKFDWLVSFRKSDIDSVRYRVTSGPYSKRKKSPPERKSGQITFGSLPRSNFPCRAPLG